ncbi:MAG: twin transmembrane helix small protein [Pseudomonadota bacterium]
MWIKIIVLIAMAAVLINLFAALFHLMKGGEGSSQKTLKALIWRLAISIAIFIGLYLASFFGLIAPHGLPQAQESAASAGPLP